MTIQIGDMLYDTATKRIGMIVDKISYGWRIEWGDDKIEYMWDHTVEHYKSRWEWLKEDIANGWR